MTPAVITGKRQGPNQIFFQGLRGRMGPSGWRSASTIWLGPAFCNVSSPMPPLESGLAGGARVRGPFTSATCVARLAHGFGADGAAWAAAAPPSSSTRCPCLTIPAGRSAGSRGRLPIRPHWHIGLPGLAAPRSMDPACGIGQPGDARPRIGQRRVQVLVPDENRL